MQIFGIVVAFTFFASRADSDASGRRREGGGIQLDEFEAASPRPTFRLTPQNVTVSPGAKASLKCRVEQLGTKTVIWRKANDSSPLTIGNYPFAADARISVDYNQRNSEWMLMIQDVRTSDEGLYICQVSTKNSSEHMFTVQLNVNTIHVSGTNVVESGESISLMCNATGRPEPPHNVEWYKDERLVQSDVQRGLIVTKKIETKLLVSSLYISSSRQADAGEYTCRSSDMESASIRVVVVNVNSPVGKRTVHQDTAIYNSKSSTPQPSQQATFSTNVLIHTVAAVVVAMTTSSH